MWLSHASKPKMLGIVALAGTLIGVLPGPTALAADVTTPLPSSSLDPVVLIQFLASCLVLLMPAGIAMLAAGLTRAKNVSQTTFMVFFGCGLAVVAFGIAGFAIMQGGHGFLLRNPRHHPTDLSAFFSLAVVLCVAATIPVGAMAERWSLKNFYCCAVFVSLILFPIFGLWAWNDGWLARFGYVDVAGSGTVHALAGLFALAGAIVLGPRIGRYSRNGSLAPIPAHNVPLALLGCFLL